MAFYLIGTTPLRLDDSVQLHHAFEVDPPMKAGELRALKGTLYPMPDGKTYRIKAVETFAVSDSTPQCVVGLYFEEHHGRPFPEKRAG